MDWATIIVKAIEAVVALANCYVNYKNGQAVKKLDKDRKNEQHEGRSTKLEICDDVADINEFDTVNDSVNLKLLNQAKVEWAEADMAEKRRTIDDAIRKEDFTLLNN